MAVTRTEIVDAMVTRFAGITVGTYHRAFATVEAFRTIPVETDREEGGSPIVTQLSAAIVRDLHDEVTNNSSQTSYTLSDHSMDVRIEVIAEAGATLAAVREHIADINKSIGTDETWGGKAIYTVPLRDRIIVNQTDRKILGAEIEVRVVYRTTRWQES